MKDFGRFYLDKEKDIVVTLQKEKEQLFYTLKTPNHKSGNLITNFAKLCDLPLRMDDTGLLVIKGEVPCYVDGNNRKIYIFRLGNTKVANIYLDGTIEMKASIPSISKTLMSQTKKYKLDEQKTIIKTYILNQYKFETDLHTHMNAILPPDILMALGIMHQIRYPLYYVKKLNLKLSKRQQTNLMAQRKRVEKQFQNSPLEGKYLVRKIDDNTFINFADLILHNLANAEYNLSKIRASLSILKDGQAVFTNLEKVYLYRYVFTKGVPCKKPIHLKNLEHIQDKDIVRIIHQIQKDRHNRYYQNNSLFQDKLLWIGRTYQAQGIRYVEISDTTLVKKYDSIRMLKEVHEVMPHIYKETGVLIRFLAAFRRIPLTLVKGQEEEEGYLQENIQVLKGIALDPYVAGSDFVGEEINDIRELEPVLKEITHIAKDDPTFVIRIHAGENDSLKDNVANSIACVKRSLEKGQKMPHMRIGHGLYTTNLKGKKGQALVKEIKKNGVVLEFQMTSNVRLNNLNSLETHPLKQYLKEGIRCVQGTDGGAIYGTSCIDEQLSLEKLLNLTGNDLKKMKETDHLLATQGIEAFHKKEKAFLKKLKKDTIENLLIKRIEAQQSTKTSLKRKKVYDSHHAFEAQIEELPWDKYPIVIAGGSFNSDQHKTKMVASSKLLLDQLMEHYKPEEVFFVIGHTLTAYEEYLVKNNKKGFKIFAIVPALLSVGHVRKLKKEELGIRVSTELLGMGIYKSFNYEIFERRPFTLIAFDGNSAVMNLIQEAHNGKGKGKIFISTETRALKNKAQSLTGYVEVFKEAKEVIEKL